jgi:hypothetical protein
MRGPCLCEVLQSQRAKPLIDQVLLAELQCGVNDRIWCTAAGAQTLLDRRHGCRRRCSEVVLVSLYMYVANNKCGDGHMCWTCHVKRAR